MSACACAFYFLSNFKMLALTAVSDFSLLKKKNSIAHFIPMLWAFCKLKKHLTLLILLCALNNQAE